MTMKKAWKNCWRIRRMSGRRGIAEAFYVARCLGWYRT